MRLTITHGSGSSSACRVDTWLAEELERLGRGISRSGLRRVLAEGGVTLSGKPVKPSYAVKPGDAFDIVIPEPAEPGVSPEDIPLRAVYEDSSVIVVEKPRGMVVHPAPGHSSGTLVNALLHRCKGSLSGVNGILRPGIVHRIDRDTSGLLAVAKTDAAHRSLSGQLMARTVKREYTAVVKGPVTEPFTVDKPIARHREHRKKMAVDPAGRRAVTHITPVRALEKGHTLIKANLETGRTHQIRVHMAYVNRPVLGDTLYGGERQPFGLTGQVLHAGLLGFTHPETGEYLEFRSDLPDYFETVLRHLS